MSFRRLLAAALLGATVFVPMVAPAGASEAAKEGEAAKPIYIDALPVVVSIISRGAVRGQLVTDFTYGVASEEAKVKVEAKMPHLRDAAIRTLSGYASSRVDPRRQLDTETIAWLLQQSADQILGPGGARVYLKVANVRKF